MAFSWSKFDPAFIRAILLASDEYADKRDEIMEEDDEIGLFARMNALYPSPDKKFIFKYRTIIEQDLFKKYPEIVRKICKILNVNGASFNIKQANLTRKPLSSTLVIAYINALLDISGMNVDISEYNKFSYTVALNMTETPAEDVPLYDFQEKAVAALKKHFITDDNASGMLIMPTGSGKSRTASYFLIREMISRGYQILWIAHRHMLIDQAADCFFRFSGLSKFESPKIKNYRINCISGEHLSIRQVGDSEVVVASISSICRNKEHLRRILGKKVMIVVDEMQHAFAPTYRDTIKFIKKCRKNAKLLGITATPVRSNEKDSEYLRALFDNNIVFEETMGNLIARGILADPHCTRISTEECFENEISDDEAKLIRRYGELPETLVSKIASSFNRNQIILKEFLENKEKYGKTLIFAMNVVHCRLLCEELQKAGVRCGHIYSGKNDNARVIENFKNNKLDVLVNVNIMTEGSDVPDIQTVFLTRPTQSEGLLMQMIGRGMRGIKANGTQTVNIVDFHDHWNTFNKWLDPKWIISDEMPEDPEKQERIPTIYEKYEWRLCVEAYKSLKSRMHTYGKTFAFPALWYSLINEHGELSRMLVFEDQIRGITAMKKDKASWIYDKSATPEDMINRYFGYFCTQPALRDIELFMDNIRNCDELPTAKLLSDRKKADPYFVVKDAEKAGAEIFSYASQIWDECDIARDFFETREEYIMEVCRAKIYGDKNIPLGLRVEELPIELIPFDRTPYYNLDELVQEVKDEMFGGKYDGISDISWTDRAYKTYYGIYHHNNNSIQINSVLNSCDVPREAVKYIIYHELLHRDYPDHNTKFREEEHKYPHFEYLEAFLDGKMPLFDIKEW